MADGGVNSSSHRGKTWALSRDEKGDPESNVETAHWDTAQHNALADDGLPNPLNFDFSKGFGGADLNFNHWIRDIPRAGVPP
jgi:hypothetical protein